MSIKAYLHNMTIDPNHRYKVSYPKVQIARARNKCRVCKRAIVKGEKYLFCWFGDQDTHWVNTKGFRHTTGFHVHMKYCKECAIELLRLKNENLLLGVRHEERVIEALDEMLFKRDRFAFLKELDPLNDYLQAHNYKPSSKGVVHV